MSTPTTLSAALTLALVSGGAAVQANENPFEIKKLEGGYQLAAADDKADSKTTKGSEKACGGEKGCGGNMKDKENTKKDKGSEKQCGGEKSCGGDMKKGKGSEKACGGEKGCGGNMKK